eukprot:6852187-Pyramimonas_sp.AAC.1
MTNTTITIAIILKSSSLRSPPHDYHKHRSHATPLPYRYHHRHRSELSGPSPQDGALPAPVRTLPGQGQTPPVS